MSLPIEEWRPITGLEGRFEVSSLGRVRCITDRARVPYRKTYAGARYLNVAVDKGQNINIHVAACEAFHGPKPEWAELVRHLNDDPHDNRAENLAWGTHADNSLDAIRNGCHSGTRKSVCANGHPFVEGSYRLAGPNRAHRRCIECERAKSRRQHQRRRAASTAGRRKVADQDAGGTMKVLTDRQAAVLARVEQSTVPLTVREITADLGLLNRTVRHVLSTLERYGCVAKRGVALDGSQCWGKPESP